MESSLSVPPQQEGTNIRLMIVDDQILMREALTTAFSKEPGIKVVGFCKDDKEALSKYDELLPDVVLMDINMKPVNGFEITRRILQKHPAASIIGLSIHVTHSYAAKMMATGAKGYLPKTSSYKDIIKAVQKVHSGETYVYDGLQQDEE